MHDPVGAMNAALRVEHGMCYYCGLRLIEGPGSAFLCARCFREQVATELGGDEGWEVRPSVLYYYMLAHGRKEQ